MIPPCTLIEQPCPRSDLPDLSLDKRNKRLVIHSYTGINAEGLAKSWISLANQNDLEKIWLWAYPKDVPAFNSYGFIFEGRLADADDSTPSCSLAYYLKPDRANSLFTASEDEILRKISRPIESFQPLPSQMTLNFLAISHCNEISRLLQSVFESYPTPMNEPEYIRKLMEKGCLFGGIFEGGKLISIAAAYPEKNTGRWEMTDCATAPDYRGLALTEKIIAMLEPEVAKIGDFTFYSLARARSFGMNRVFCKLGYKYCGRLTNNCHIAGNLEDMNLWAKDSCLPYKPY